MNFVNIGRELMLLILMVSIGSQLSCQRTTSVKMKSIGDPQAATNREPPEVTLVSATNDNGSYKTGDAIVITVQFSKVVNLKGDNELKLLLATGETDREAVYQAGSGTTTLSLVYHVTAGDHSDDLQYTGTDALSLGATSTLQDDFSHDAVLTLPALDSAESLGEQKKLVIGATHSTVDKDGAIADDYGIYFEKDYYQTRSIKRILVPSQHIASTAGQVTILMQNQSLSCTVSSPYSSLFVASTNKIAQLDFIDDNQAGSIFDTITYGTEQKITLSLKGTGIAANTSTPKVTLKDFEIFGPSSTSFDSGNQIEDGFQGWMSPLSGSVQSDDTVIAVGLHDMIY